MKYASVKVLGLVLATGSLIAACATGTDTSPFDTGGSSSLSGSPDTGPTSGAGGSGGSNNVTTSTGVDPSVGSTGSGAPDGGGVCIPKCNADSDCQNSCPVAQTGINCCDAPSGFCYVASQSICPAPKPDGGTMMPPY